MAISENLIGCKKKKKTEKENAVAFLGYEEAHFILYYEKINYCASFHIVANTR